jgi:hypothetical protein
MNFKTHAPARREGTTLQPNIHIQNSQDVHRKYFFSLLANLKTIVTRYNGGAAPLRIAQSPEFTILV